MNNKIKFEDIDACYTELLASIPVKWLTKYSFDIRCAAAEHLTSNILNGNLEQDEDEDYSETDSVAIEAGNAQRAHDVIVENLNAFITRPDVDGEYLPEDNVAYLITRIKCVIIELGYTDQQACDMIDGTFKPE